MTDIKSLNYDELVTYMAGLGEKKFRASQLYQWMHEKLADSFDECTNLSNALRQKLKETSEYVCLEPVRVQRSKLDGTEKYLFRLTDGNYVESVLMKVIQYVYLHRLDAVWDAVSVHLHLTAKSGI